MKQSTLKVLFSLLAVAMALLSPLHSYAQFAEKIEKKCKGLEYENRVRVAVGSFKSTTNRAYGQFAGELATMLSNALVSTECFQVLASTKSNVMDDMQDEKEFQRSEDVDPNAAVEDGKMMGAQLIVTGEVTEFAEGKDGVQVGVINVGKNKAKVGFILQIANPKTRQIIFSESINTEAAALGGFSGVRILGLPAIGSFKTRAMADAVEKAIIKAVELIVAQKDKIQAMPTGGVVDPAMSPVKTSIVKIENVDYTKLNSLTTVIKGDPKVKDAAKVLSSGVGTITVKHEGSFDELLDYLAASAPGYEIIGAEKGQITLKVKN